MKGHGNSQFIISEIPLNIARIALKGLQMAWNDYNVTIGSSIAASHTITASQRISCVQSVKI